MRLGSVCSGGRGAGNGAPRSWRARFPPRHGKPRAGSSFSKLDLKQAAGQVPAAFLCVRENCYTGLEYAQTCPRRGCHGGGAVGIARRYGEFGGDTAKEAGREIRDGQEES